ncbi:hypothetical protein BDR06DRAFT_1050849, partial [Suillus hirtellus]
MNMWIHSCFILHNLIVEIEETENCEDSNICFYQQTRRLRRADGDGGEDDQQQGGAVGDQTYIGTVGQDFHNTLKMW